MGFSEDIRKSPTESDLQFIWRMCSAKDAGTLDLTWQELAEILNRQLVDDESEFLGESAYRKKYQQAKAFYEDVFSKMQSDEYSTQIEEQRRELQKERYKFYDQRNAYNKQLRSRARQEEINEIIYDVIERGNLPTLPSVDQDSVILMCQKSSMLISLNDIHYGANVSNAWNTYNSDICADRFRKYLEKIKHIQLRNECEEAVVWCNGDEISGNIHYEIAVTNKENVIEQIMGVSELIAHFLCELSTYFPVVRFVSVSGNHSRIGKKEDALKNERLDNLVEWYLKARLAHIENIKFDTHRKIDETMYVVDVQGLCYAGCHGDYDSGRNRVLDLQTMLREPIYGVLMGHLHHNMTDTYQGIKLIMSGSFQGMDDYCVQKRIFGYAEQMVTIVDKDGIVANYDIKLQ